MTPDEVAVVQALQRTLDWTDGDDGRDFRAWWLDEDTSLDEIGANWPAVWAAVADAACHPTVVAHLSDLLWTARHGAAHLHARRAVDAYFDAAVVLDEPHDRCRSLIRAHELASAIRDSDRLAVAEARLCDAAESELTGMDLGVALALLDHLFARRLATLPPRGPPSCWSAHGGPLLAPTTWNASPSCSFGAWTMRGGGLK